MDKDMLRGYISRSSNKSKQHGSRSPPQGSTGDSVVDLRGSLKETYWCKASNVLDIESRLQWPHPFQLSNWSSSSHRILKANDRRRCDPRLDVYHSLNWDTSRPTGHVFSR